MPRKYLQGISASQVSSYFLLQPLHLQQSPQQQPFFLFFITDLTAKARAAETAKVRMISAPFIQFTPINISTALTMSAAIHATPHCHITSANAHFFPSSRLTAAIAATQGV